MVGHHNQGFAIQSRGCLTLPVRAFGVPAQKTALKKLHSTRAPGTKPTVADSCEL